MKLYTDFTGKFQMYIPLNWEYKNPSLYRPTEEGTPHAFGFYDKYLGVFQLSCKKVTKHIKELIETRKEPIQSSDSKHLIFSEQFIPSDKQLFYAFSCAVDDHYFFATYIVKPKKSLLNKIEFELEEVRKVLASVKFIKEQFRQILITERRFDLYMASIATIIELKNNAIKKDSYIEYVVFSANHIDALLRLSIILINQITNKNEDIDLRLLFQSETDKKIMERTIYKKCLDNKIINHDLFNELERLYEERNKVIHRFIITDIRTEDIYKLAFEYQNLFDKIDSLISSLEEVQIKLKIGVWGKQSQTGMTDDEMKIFRTKIKDKQGLLPEKK